MPSRVKIVYEPDDSCGRLPHKPGQGNDPKSTSVVVPFNEKIEKLVIKAKKSNVIEGVTGRAQIITENLDDTNKSKKKRQAQPTETMANKQFEILRDKCLKQKILYEDPDFEASVKSIGKLSSFDTSRVEWKRPKEINPGADFVKNAIDRFDIKQGNVGDCWLLAVISSITNYPKLLNYVVPMDQAIKNNPSYAGIFRFRFWQFGKWIDVIIDDRLPVFKGTNNLAFMRSTDTAEFWSPLLEKAYAKLNGCYANLEGGLQAEAMEDFTGGICETIDLKKPPADLLDVMCLNMQKCCLMGCSVNAKVGEIEERQNSGLVKGHAYSVTGVDYVTYNGKKQWLVRARNPWGNSTEWNGPFSDNSPEWKSVSDADKKRLSVTFAQDGEAWMSYESFLAEYTTLEMCQLGPEAIEKNEITKGKTRYEESVFTGQWVKNVSAGGCLNNKETFWMNPQFKIVIPDEGHDHDHHHGYATVGLMQKDTRSKSGSDYIPIGFSMYLIPNETNQVLDRQFFMTHRPLETSKFAPTREVVVKKHLEPGTYVIVPSTFNKDVEGSFIVRCFTMEPIENEEVDNVTKGVQLPDAIRKMIHSGDKGHDHDKQVKAKFEQLKNKKNCINAKQLVTILNSSDMKNVKGFKEFTLEMGRSLLALVDYDISGQLDFEEFDTIWEDCELWKFIFEKTDADNCGALQPGELREAIKMAGFIVSNKTFAAIVMRYADPDTGNIMFGDFILCMARLKNTIENMSYQDQTTSGHRLFTEDDFTRYSIYM